MTEILFESTPKIDKADLAVVVAKGQSLKSAWLEKFLDSKETEFLDEVFQNDYDCKKEGGFAVYQLPDRKVSVATAPKDPKETDFQIIGGKIAQKMKDCTNIVCVVANEAFENADKQKSAYNIALGFELGGYSFDKYFTTKKACEYSSVEKLIIASEGIEAKGWAEYAALANGVRYARDLTNEPANYLLPEVFAQDIKRLEYLGLEVDILEPDELKENNFNLLLAVAQGSDNPPRVAVIRWKGNPDSEEYDAGFVGKGVTFDAGGLSLKSSPNLLTMNHDMAGAAVMVATMKVAALQKLKANLIAIVGLVENMPSGKAIRVNDIVASMSGQTVEILNTDAEGRLVLADCLWYLGTNFAPKVMIDAATLTGAVANLFGREFAGIMGNNNELTQNLIAAGNLTGEKLWELPLTKAYDDMIKSDFADMKNIGGKIAGGMTAACFLRRFIPNDIKWAHLDIAGVDNQEKPTPLNPKGATGFGVCLLNRFIKEYITK